MFGQGGLLEQFVAEAGDDEDGEFREVGLYDLEYLQPVDVGHENVGDHVIVAGSLCARIVKLVDCRYPVRAGSAGESLLREPDSEIPADLWFVINDQDSFWHVSTPSVRPVTSKALGNYDL